MPTVRSFLDEILPTSDAIGRRRRRAAELRLDEVEGRIGTELDAPDAAAAAAVVSRCVGMNDDEIAALSRGVIPTHLRRT